MPLEAIRLERKEARDSYAAMFSSALLRPERETPSLIAGPKGKGAVKRYNVYRNNVTVSLIEALAAIFPAVRRITGEEFFGAMARFHIRETPPSSPLLFEYGRDFPAFIARYEYAQDMPWLADVARIERAWLDAYHAADAEPLSPSALAVVPAERGGEPGTRRGERFKAQGGEQPRRAQVPRVRQQEGLARAVQRQELACLVGLNGHDA